MDASNRAIFAVSHQWVDGVLAPISCESRLLTMTERKYSTYKMNAQPLSLVVQSATHVYNTKNLNFIVITWLLLVTEEG